MSLKSINPVKTKAWNDLKDHYDIVKDMQMKNLFVENPERANEMSIIWDEFLLDYSKNRITTETLSLFKALADEMKLNSSISKYFGGFKINKTENRSVLHTALRAPRDSKIEVDGINIISEIFEVKNKIRQFSNGVISGQLKGYTNKNFTDIVNVGIGGSDLGPSMVINALTYYSNHLKLHFINNIDGDYVSEVLKRLNPETTLFVIVSKTFTTQETISNAHTIKKWFLKSASSNDLKKHLVAVTANIKEANDFGVESKNVFKTWDWVGGRFSLWSAAGLSINLAIGNENFERLLDGAHKMDLHFQNAPFEKNIPIITAMLSIWYNNFFNADSEAIIPYSQYLRELPAYLQQAVMESNGKSIDRFGKKVDYQTGNIIWGGVGTNAQHAFFQLIHQGTKLIPADFIAFKKSLYGNNAQHDKLISNFLAQSEALLSGKTKDQVVSEINDKEIIPYKIFPGNRPTNTIFIDKLTPENLGKLIAMYEHKIFVQGIMWNIYSFDQFGVELGKKLAGRILSDFSKDELNDHDASTKRLINNYKNFQ